MSVHPHVQVLRRHAPPNHESIPGKMALTGLSMVVLAVVAYVAFLYQPSRDLVSSEPTMAGQRGTVVVAPIDESEITNR
jgi:hypothetical protein